MTILWSLIYFVCLAAGAGFVGVTLQVVEIIPWLLLGAGVIVMFLLILWGPPPGLSMTYDGGANGSKKDE